MKNMTDKIITIDAQDNFQVDVPSSSALLWHFKKNGKSD